MNGIDLLDVPDIAELPYEHLATILDDPMVKAKLSAMQKEVEEKRKAAELDVLIRRAQQAHFVYCLKTLLPSF